MFNHKQVIIDSFNPYELTVETDDSEDLLVYSPSVSRDGAVVRVLASHQVSRVRFSDPASYVR